MFCKVKKSRHTLYILDMQQIAHNGVNCLLEHNMELTAIFLFFHFGATLIVVVQALPYSPWLSSFRHGPLYEGVKLLIADAETQAKLAWNETEYQLNEALAVMQETQTLLAESEHTIEDRLRSMLADLRPTDIYKNCYHQHELAIATFGRDFLNKWRSCKRMLAVSLTTLQNEDHSEINFIRSAAAEARNILAACNVAALKRVKDSNDQSGGMAMCVVGRIGALDQRLFEASQNFFDELAAVALNGNGGSQEDTSCGDFDELRQQFDSVYRDIDNCIRRGVV